MISAIVAADKNWGIGYKNKLLCPIKEDLKNFKRLTTNNVVVMGRKTWDSLPIKPLPNRSNIVVTSSVEKMEVTEDNVILVTLDLLKKCIDEIGESHNVFVIGGGQIYKELLPCCDYVFLTRIHKSFENVDTYFPELKENEWKLVEKTSIKTQNDIKYQFCIYKKEDE